MERQIVCFGIPSLDIALARLHDPQLRTRPLGISNGSSARSLIREVSSEAERDGVKIGMPVDRAQRFCPTLHIYPPNPRAVVAADRAILAVVQRYAPTWEPARPGSMLLDLTGTTRLLGSACDVAAKVQAEVLAQVQLEGVAGVGSNKLIAQTASTLVGPSELYDVRQGSERLFMSPLSVRTLPGVHRPCMRPVLKHLDDLNLCTLGDVVESPLDALALVVGQYAGQLSRWAQGIDPTPVQAPVVQPSLEGTIPVDPDEVDDTLLWGHLADGLQRLCRTLRQQRRMCGAVSLTIRHSDQRELTASARVIPDTCWEIDVSEALQRLFHRLFTRRIRLRLMRLSLTKLTGFAEQGSLFDDRSAADQHRRDRAQRLAVALDQLHDRFGERAIRYGRTH
jgi:DNA polymerase IV